MNRRQPRRVRAAGVAMLAAALAALAFATSASAFSELYSKFKNCPYKTEGVLRCLYSVTRSGEVVLGNKKVPITNAVTLQGGYGKATEGFAKLVAPLNGVDTLSKTPQSVPGGLLGIVPSEGAPFLVKKLIKFFTDNSLTALNATLELTGAASTVELSEANLRLAEGVALKMPVKAHLENPFLGSKCFVGSSSSPLKWNLTAATTSPPGPNKPITGNTGEITFLDGGRILHLEGNSLVDNAWSAPGASGCGGLLGFLVNPIVNLQLGTTTAGHNTAILNNTIDISSSSAVKKDNELHP